MSDTPAPTNTIRDRLKAVGARMPHNQPKSLVWGRFVFAGTTVDAATTAYDLTQSGSLKSEAIKTRLGIALPVANPGVCMLIERVGIAFHTGLEFDLLIEKYAQEMYLHHGPISDEDAYIDLSGHLTSAMDPNGGGVVATGAFGSQVHKAVTYPLLTPLLVDLENDDFDCGPHTAVDAGAALPFTIFVDGFAWKNQNYERTDFVSPIDGPGDLKWLLEERARHEVLRGYRDGKYGIRD